MKGNTFSMSSKITTRKLALASLFLAISIVLGYLFAFFIPVAGFSAVKISFSSAMNMITGIVCGPALGFVSGVLTDIIMYFIKPAGAYFPPLTLTAGLAGLLPGLIFKLMKKEKLNYNLINTIMVALLSGGCVAGFILKGILKIEGNMLYYNDAPLSIVFIIGYIVLTIFYIAIPILITKKFNVKYKANKILFAVSITQFITSIILNTYFLSLMMGKGFIVFLPARILQNFFLIPIYTIVMSTLLDILDRVFKLKF